MMMSTWHSSMPTPELVGPGGAQVWKLDHTQPASAASRSAPNQGRMHQPAFGQERGHRRVTIDHNHNVEIYSAGSREGVGVGRDDAEDTAAMQALAFSNKTIKAARLV